MNFKEALTALQDGERVRRRWWPQTDYLYIEDSVLWLHKVNKCGNEKDFGQDHISVTDIFAEDWEQIED